MASFNWNKHNFIDYLDWKNKEIRDLPHGVNISTMCASCKLNNTVNLTNIEKYLPLNSDDIITVKLNKDNMRSLIEQKSKKRRSRSTTAKVKKSTPFYNQITIVVRIKEGEYKDLNDEKKLNIKLFKNGSIQISGLKKIEYCNRALNKLIYRLQETKGIKIGNTISDIHFIDSNEKNKLSVSSFKIYMINSNYKVNLHIDRNALYQLLKLKKIKSSFEKTIRACVIVKYIPPKNNTEEKEVSIFIFEKGNIIITGARNLEHIKCSYEYINKILLNHTNEISLKNSDENDKLILKLYDEIMNDYKHNSLKLGIQ